MKTIAMRAVLSAFSAYCVTTLPHAICKEAVPIENLNSAPPSAEINRPASEISPPTAQTGEAKKEFKKVHPHLVLALSGGACKSVAQIGVLRSFEKNHIPVDGIVGTSMGATIGALYCAGVSTKEIEQMFVDGTLHTAILRGAILSIIGRPFSPLIHLVKGRPYVGITAGKGYEKLLAEKLPENFDGLKIPFAAVATNLTDGQTVVFSKGNLPRAVLASSCVPLLYRPVEIDDKLYVDGGLKANLPTDIAEKMGSEIVVAVLVDTAIKPVPNNTFKSKIKFEKRIVDIMLASADKTLSKSSDVLIYPDVDFVPPITKDPVIIERAVAAGEKAADSVASKIAYELTIIAQKDEEKNARGALKTAR